MTDYLPAPVLGEVITVPAERWAWIELLHWIEDHGHEAGMVPWLDTLTARIDRKVTG